MTTIPVESGIVLFPFLFASFRAAPSMELLTECDF